LRLTARAIIGSCGSPARSPTSPAATGSAAFHVAEALAYRARLDEVRRAA
jgi:hypothetical protein